MKVYVRSALAGLFFLSNIGFSQTYIEDVENFLLDMVFISNQYVSPAADASVYQSTSSWHNSARSLDKFEMDISLHFNVLPIPDKQKQFEVSNSDFNSIYFQDGSQTGSIPTALGGDTETFFDFYIDGEPYEFQAFEGAKESVLYYPYLQASIGLWYETDLTIQYVPKIKISDSGYQTYGLALKHNLSQYFRNDSDTGGVEIAAQLGYIRFLSEIFFDDFVIKSTDPNSSSEPLAVLKSLNIESDTWVFNLIGSKRLDRLEFVASIALASNKFNYTMGGEDSLVLDLLNQSFKALEDSNGLIKGNVGINYHWNDLTLTALTSLGKFTDLNFSIHYKLF